LGYI